MLHILLASAALAGGPLSQMPVASSAAEAPLVIDAVAIAHCTRDPTPPGPVPPSQLLRLRRALDQRAAQGQLVARPILQTHVGTPAQLTMGQGLPNGASELRFRLAVDPQQVADRGVQIGVEVTVLNEVAEVGYPLSSGLGWLLRVDAAPDLYCRGWRQAETLVLVVPHSAEAGLSIETIRNRARPTDGPFPDDDLLHAFLEDMPSWM